MAVMALMKPDLFVQPPGPRVHHSVHSCGFESCRKQLAYLGLQDTDAEAERSPDEAWFFGAGVASLLAARMRHCKGSEASHGITKSKSQRLFWLEAEELDGFQVATCSRLGHLVMLDTWQP